MVEGDEEEENARDHARDIDTTIDAPAANGVHGLHDGRPLLGRREVHRARQNHGEEKRQTDSDEDTRKRDGRRKKEEGAVEGQMELWQTPFS